MPSCRSCPARDIDAAAAGRHRLCRHPVPCAAREVEPGRSRPSLPGWRAAPPVGPGRCAAPGDICRWICRGCGPPYCVRRWSADPSLPQPDAADCGPVLPDAGCGAILRASDRRRTLPEQDRPSGGVVRRARPRDRWTCSRIASGWCLRTPALGRFPACLRPDLPSSRGEPSAGSGHPDRHLAKPFARAGHPGRPWRQAGRPRRTRAKPLQPIGCVPIPVPILCRGCCNDARSPGTCLARPVTPLLSCRAELSHRSRAAARQRGPAQREEMARAAGRR